MVNAVDRNDNLTKTRAAMLRLHTKMKKMSIDAA